MRQGRPWVILAVDCRQGLHGRCLHGTEQFTGHSRYFVLCACDCHPRRTDDIEELRELRRELTASGTISGNYNPSLPQLWTHDDDRAAPGCRRRVNPLAELVELSYTNHGGKNDQPSDKLRNLPPEKPAKYQARHLPQTQTSFDLPTLRQRDPRHPVPRSGDKEPDLSTPPAPAATLVAYGQVDQVPATLVACTGAPGLATSIAMDNRTRVSKALECRGCQEKRQVVEWMSNGYSGNPYAQWRLCAVCLLDALRLLLAKNITRQKPEKAGQDDGRNKEAPHGEAVALLRAQTRRAVPRARRGRHLQRATQRRRRVRNKRRRTKR